MLDDQISANYFFLKKLPNLQVFRVERHGSATIYWTSRMALLRYLQDLQDTMLEKDGSGHCKSMHGLNCQPI